MTVTLKPHQQKAVDQLTDGKVLLGGVGAGKTHTALAYYMKHHSDKDLYVITTARKRDELDWQNTAAAFGIGPKDATVAGALTVDSWNNIRRYEKVRGAFFIFDEQRLVGKGAWVKVFLAIAKNCPWILLSATPGDTWMDYCPLFIANGFYKNRTDFVRRHVVYNQFTKFPSIDRYVDTGVLARRRKQIMVRMPFARSTVRHVKTVPVGSNQDLFERVGKQRWNIYEDRPIKDVGELCRVARKLANTDKSRLTKLGELMSKHPRLIVFYNFDYELEMLRSYLGSVSHIDTKESLMDRPHTSSSRKMDGSQRIKTSKNNFGDSSKKTATSVGGVTQNCTDGIHNNGKKATGTKMRPGDSGSGASTLNEMITDGTKSTHISTSLTVAEWNGHKHEAVPTGDRWVYLVQYTAGSEAWNCVTTDAMVFYSLNYSYKIFEQCQGRIDRMNTRFVDLYYYVFRSNTFIDQSIWKSLVSKQTFNEKNLVL